MATDPNRTLQGAIQSKRAPDLRVFDQAMRNVQGAAGAPSRAPLQRVVFPPWVYKLGAQSTDFTVQSFTEVLPAGAGQQIAPAALQFSLPGSMVGWIDIFEIFVQAPTNLTSVTFALTINGSPVPGYTKQVPPGVANLFVQPFSGIQIRIPNGGQVGVLITNGNASGPWTLGAVVSGWYHSWQYEQQVFGESY
jgi:hypothetical protein